MIKFNRFANRFARNIKTILARNKLLYIKYPYEPGMIHYINNNTNA